jgi:uncharacterized protein DUF4402
MKKSILTGLAIVIALFVTGTAFAAEATASATIVSAIAIAAGSPMSFGRAVADPSATKTVVLSTAGVLSGSAIRPSTTSGTASSFAVTGDPSATFAITLPGDSDVTIVNGENSMTVTAFESAAASGTQGTLSGAGTQTLNVGATLTVGAAQPSGLYTGNFNVYVAYN